MAVYQVSTAAEVVSAVGKAAAGDRIELAPGSYRTIHLKDAVFSDDVTITSADPGRPALITGRFIFQNSANVTLEGVDFDTLSLPSTRDKFRLYVRDSRDIELRDLDMNGYIVGSEGASPDASTTNSGDPITGYAFDTGIRIGGSKNVVVSNTSFEDYRSAILIGGAENVTLSGLDISKVREGVNFRETDGLKITNSHFHDFRPWVPFSDPAYDSKRHDHPDMVQYWGSNSVKGVHDVTVTGNLFEMDGGERLQVVFGHLRSGPDSVTASNFTVKDNYILNSHPNSIYLGDVVGGVVEGNVLLPSGPLTNTSWTAQIKLPRAKNIDVIDNVLVENRSGVVFGMDDGDLARAGITTSGNTILSNSPSDSDYWGKWLDANPPKIGGTTSSGGTTSNGSTGGTGGGTGGGTSSGGADGGASTGGSTGSGSSGDGGATETGGKLTIGGTGYAVGSFAASSQDKGNATVSDGGKSLTLDGNAWKYAKIGATVTSDTVLSFDFSAGKMGEIHGVGFANGDRYSPDKVFWLAGSQNWGRRDADWRYDGSGTDRVEIKVGDYLRGDYDRIVFINDDDAGTGASSTFSDIRLKTAAAPAPSPKPSPTPTEEESADGVAVNGKTFALNAFAPGVQDAGDAAVASGGSKVTLSGNSWKAIERPTTLDADSVLSFDFAGDAAAEIHGIGFTNGGRFDEDTFFRLGGTQNWGTSGADWRYDGSGTDRIEIEVGRYVTGDFDRLVILRDDDAGVGGESSFANITIA